MKTRKELIEEVLRLDKERTQGEWEISGLCTVYKNKYSITCGDKYIALVDEGHREYEQDANAQFIALSSRMPDIIRDQQKQIGMLVEAVNILGDCHDRSGMFEYAQETLSRIKSGEWMD